MNPPKLKLNNGICFDYTETNYMTDFSKCTFFFDSDSSENLLKGLLRNDPILGFRLKNSVSENHSKNNFADVIISFPENFKCVHYKEGTVIYEVSSSLNSHLTYHGKQLNTRKITGEIHIKLNGELVYKNQKDKLEAPLSNSSNILLYPLPICRIELSDKINSINLRDDINNYFGLATDDFNYNVIEIHLSKKGFMKKLLTAEKSLPIILGSLFVNTSMQTFSINEIQRRPGEFPQILVLQTQSYELIVLAGYEYKNPFFSENRIHHFHTKDYFENIINRYCVVNRSGFFISKYNQEIANKDAIKISSLINPY